MLPNEKAAYPEEESHEPNSQGNGENDGDSPTATPTDNVNSRKKITFHNATASEPASQSSSTYKELLSQPASTLTHRNRLLWLQKRRDIGLWAQCDDCDQWRHLPHVLDAQELPTQWRCAMNPDKSYANCSVPEAPLRVHDEEDLIHSEYAAGSIVWARLAGWPWWPAMVDDDPDTEQFYWLDGFSDIPTYYNVTFFDANEVTHAWIAPSQLKPYEKNRDIAKQVNKEKKYKKRLGAALSQAEEACRLSLQKRLAKYSFLARYPGSINPPKKVTRVELKRFNDRFKRQYNVQLEMEYSSESEDENLASKKRKKEAPNKIILGKGKKIKETVEKADKHAPEKRTTNVIDNVAKISEESPAGTKEQISVQDVAHTSKPDNIKETAQLQNNDTAPEVNAIAHENTANETIPEAEGSFDNDTSDTYVPPKDLPTQSTYTESQSINPNDFQTEPVVHEDLDITLAETPKTARQDNIITVRKLEDSMNQLSEEVTAKTPAPFKPVFKTPSSMSLQVGSYAAKTSTFVSLESDTSKTCVADSESDSDTIESSLRRTVKDIARSTSGGSDDFDF